MVGARGRRAALLACALVCAACSGAIEGAAGPGATGDSGAPAGPGPGAAFALNRETVRALPWRMRMLRVANLIGVGEAHASMKAIREGQIDLGQYDFALRLQPDLTWTPSRVAAWAKAVKPVCESAEFAAKFPNLPENYGSLIEAAFGRAATVDDVADFDQAMDEAGLTDPEAIRDLACLTVLSSAEMVLQ